MKFSELKSQAKSTIHPHKTSLYKASAIYFLLTLLISMGSGLFGSEEGYNFFDFTSSFGTILFYPIFLANIALIHSIYEKDSSEFGVFDLYKDGKKFVRSILAYIIPNLFIFLWIVPFAIVLGFLVGFTGQNAFLIAVIPLIILAIYKSLQYSLVPFVLSADENIGVMDALNESKRLLKGNVGQLFLLNLSFIGWGILIILTVGILGIWIFPYYNATIYEYFLRLQGNEDSVIDEEKEETNITPTEESK
ncbi:DUF975 family protein [[Brevibacterium] frigoritolerans]|nr:DUF975 family protein [Peribacillus frigoritolerans]